ncbi:MAG TPA: hypothetical protein VIY68_18635 [Steroidobacteraceae bacterium]
MNVDGRYWFRAKRSGLGWGLPCSWQGWAFFLIWLCVLVICALKLIHSRPLMFALALTILTLILVAVCYIKGEPLSDGVQ